MTINLAPAPGDATRLKMSYEEFLAWADEDVHAEWVNGEVTVEMPAKEIHQNIVEFLHHILDLFARLLNLGRVHTAPFEMRVLADGPAREPDLLFVANENLERLNNDRLVGPADLIVEVISSDSVYRDRVDKFEEYEAGGIREYWIVDPRPGKQRADFWVLDANGRYRTGEIKDGIYRSTVLPGFWLRVEWLIVETLPDPLATLAQIVGKEKIIAALG
ncbi:MAG: Uma2 family endonuclease [Chloroflexi bacterium]|nr:Uma2 family endonuclease [Chloroflexota bacterium]